jgi:rhamnose utilization protein RhaD (predicted bifunctional aldolase and dehydrogenase)/NAD(P)-dependent dehydrogenase (short-subunit alcohol dehydrogenase family)
VAQPPCDPELIACVAASRRIGSDPRLVLHGGGNSSVKLRERDLSGRERAVLRVKGSGFDLATIGPEGFAPLDLEALVALRDRACMDDQQMVAALEAFKLDPRAPFPSVEALLHAWIPARHVLHTHAVAMLILTNQPQGRSLIESALGASFVVLDYVMPGLALARAAADALASRPDAIGLVCRHHGLFTWGQTAAEADQRMADAVERCERVWHQRGGRALTCSPVDLAQRRQRARRLLPILRGTLGSLIAVFRCDQPIAAMLDNARLRSLAARGVLTPDHVIRTKNQPLIIDAPEGESPGEFQARWREAVSGYEQEYRSYLARYRGERELVVADAKPRVVLIPQVGVFCFGPTAAEAAIAADITVQSLAARFDAEQIGQFAALDPKDVFEVEFWPPEQAKLRRIQRPALTGKVLVVSGAAGAIGSKVAEWAARAGAAVVISDRRDAPSRERLQTLAERIGHNALIAPADVTDPGEVEQLFDAAVERFGGVDQLVICHGLAVVGEIDQLTSRGFEDSLRVNALGSFHLLASFTKLVKSADSGGDVVLVSTKNVADPGAAFSAYSASKAAAHQLARVAALELAPSGIRVNLVAPDAVFGEPPFESKLWAEAGAERAKSRGIAPESLPEIYRQRSLLKETITPAHVAAAVLFFLERRTPTTGAVLPVDGGLPGAFSR